MSIQQEQKISYYQLVFSNFLAALGGGTILSRGVDVINVAYLKGGSRFAFFIGAVLGLALLQIIPKNKSKVIEKWFSIFSALTSVLLLIVFQRFSINSELFALPALLFFSLLCVRFGFWFYSRALRVSTAAAQQQGVALVEFGYYLGTIIGLVIWSVLGFNIGMSTALIIDIIFQIGASILDFSAHHRIKLAHLKQNVGSESTLKTNNEQEGNVDKPWCRRLAFSSVAIIIGTQCIIFDLTNYFSENFTSCILGAFYMGSALSAILCKRMIFRLLWSTEKKYFGKARLYFMNANHEKNIDFSWLCILFSLFSLSAIILTNSWIQQEHLIALSIWSIQSLLILLCCFSSSFFSGLVLFVILDRIGVEEKPALHKKMIMHTYGLMAIGAAISFWIMSFFTNMLFGLGSVSILCFIFIFISLRERKKL